MKWIRLGVAAAGLLAFAPATMGTASAAPVSPQTGSANAPAAAAPRVPSLSWAPCDDGFQCATAQVPLDYQHPDGATTSIAVIEHLATGPAPAAGTLFLNTGGPGPQIDGFVAAFAGIPAELRERFDIITFDERGFGGSSTVQCFPDAAAENEVLGGLPTGFPVGKQQDAVWEQTWAQFGDVCARNGGSLLQHDTSTDAARDMNLIRQAVGLPKLDYIGLSYGTGLGAIYANLFPATVGHMVLDGNLNPVAWSEGGSLPEALREGADLAAASVTRSFLNLCGKAATDACAFSAGTPAATQAKYARLLQRLRRHPVTIGNPPQTFTYADTINDVPLGLLAFVSDWPSAAGLLQQLWDASAAGHATTPDGTAPHSTAPHSTANNPAAAPVRPLGAASAAGHAPAANHATTSPDTAYAGPEQGIAQFCADTADPRDPHAYEAAARLGKARSGGIGLGLAWQEEPCAAWPADASQDQYTGPWNNPTASPILVIGNTGDPITPYHSAVAMSRDLASARLLTVHGFGHTENLNPDACATNYEISYLETGALPPAGTICQQDAQPFPAP
jgi:pimeloyl-ACP methyl ester carboxylesterase